MKAAFRIGSIPVRIHGSFLFLTVILAANRLNDIRLLIEWFVVVLVSVLIHEMGHALMGKAFGLTPEIDLHSMGGTTSWSAGHKLSNGRSILISLAGPLTGMIVAQLALVTLGARVPEGELARSAFEDFFFVNWYWGLFNLVPMLPLDGGNVLRSVLNAATNGRGEVPSRIIGIVLALAVAIPAVIFQLFFHVSTWWFALLGGMFAAQNYRALREHSVTRADDPLRQTLAEAYEALKEKDGPRVLRLAGPVITAAKSLPVRAEAIHIVAYGLLLEGRTAEADRMIAGLPPGYAPHPAYAELKARLA